MMTFKTMRNFILVVSIVVTTVVTTSAVVAEIKTDSQNLVLNGDFKDWSNGVPVFWGSSANNIVTQSAEGEGYGGVGRAAILQGTGEAAAWFWQLPTAPPTSAPVKPGQWLRFTVWLKLHNDSIDDTVTIRVCNVDGVATQCDQENTGALFSEKVKSVTLTKGVYKKFEVSHSLQSGAKAFCAAIQASGPVKFYVDKAVMTFIPTPPPEPIRYISPNIPEIHLPIYQGQKYHARVPDTLDLSDMAKLTIHGATSITDPNKDDEIYWFVYRNGNKPVMRRDSNHQVQVVIQRGLPLNRLVSGTSENLNVEQRWLEVLFHLKGPDGLLYYPMAGRPWVNYSGSGQYGSFSGEHYTGPLNNGASLEVLAVYYALTHDEKIKELGRGVVDGMIKQATHRIDSDDGLTYAFYDKGLYGVNEVSDPDAPHPNFTKAGALGWAALGLTRFYKTTGYQPALDFAGELCRYVQKHSGLFGSNGQWAGNMHFPWHCGNLLGMLDYAIEVNNGDMVEFVRQSYEYAKAPQRYANLLMGWFPEFALATCKTSENCGMSLMINLAVKLNQAGVGDYWDDIDRWTRNHFSESQLTEYAWMYEIDSDKPSPQVNSISESSDEVGKKNLGNFGGWVSPNDFINGETPLYFMHCCAGEACTAVYRVWENIVDYKKGKLRVNLLLNRASPWADVDSYIPYEGRVDVKVKKNCDLSIRIPEWVEPEMAKCQVSDKSRKLSWEGRYAVVGKVKSGSTVKLTFPVYKREDMVSIEGTSYTLTRKGNDVIHIEPQGRYNPLYQRDKYFQNRVKWKNTERFVAEDKLLEW